MAKIRSLHPPPPAAERPPARERLARAIEQHQSALAHFNHVKDAAPRAMDLRIAARRIVEDAEAKLAAARNAEPHRLAQRLIDGADDDGPSPVEAAAAILADAHAGLNTAIATSEALGSEEIAAEQGLDRASYALREAIAAVIAPSPAVTQLLAKFDEARARVAAMTAAFHTLGPLCLPKEGEDWRAINRPFPPIASVAAAWEQALAALQTDPDAPLPGEVPAAS
jgi:hypothetical protein